MTHPYFPEPQIQPGYTAEQLVRYAREQAEEYAKPYVKRILELEAAELDYAMQFPKNKDGFFQVDAILENIIKLKEKVEKCKNLLEGAAAVLSNSADDMLGDGDEVGAHEARSMAREIEKELRGN